MLKAVTSCFGKAERQVHVQLVNADTDWQVLTRFKLKIEKIAKPENEHGDFSHFNEMLSVLCTVLKVLKRFSFLKYMEDCLAYKSTVIPMLLTGN